MGSGLVLAGLALFMVVFFTLLPILTNPVGAYDNWFPVEEAGSDPAVSPAAPENPVARFSWEAVAIDTLDPPVYTGSVSARLRSEEWPPSSTGDGILVTATAIGVRPSCTITLSTVPTL